ncbi:MAG: hypothetical protein M1836_005968 [Candelina mexicana]|nr:MAG: hypothetical protein M1836_005968 [Candelina mexicana]
MASLNVYLVTYNCAQTPICPPSFAFNLFSALPSRQPPDILILSLQEIAPIAYSFLGGSYLGPYFSRFQYAVELASSNLSNNDGDVKYRIIITRNVGQTAIMVFARQERAKRIKWLETGGVGVGLHEMGNKGAVGIRLGYSASNYADEEDEDEGEEISLTFLAAHLAPMEDGLQRRNKDWEHIVRGLVFTPVMPKAVAAANHASESSDLSIEEDQPLLQGSFDNSTSPSSGIYNQTSHVFLGGDLNYRTSDTRPDPRAYHSYPQPTKNSADPKHYSHLYKTDQLTREIKAGRTCHGFREASIDFPPTYKFSSRQAPFSSEDEVEKWEWARHRWPSWCDRIMFLSSLPHSDRSSSPDPAKLQLHGYTPLPKMDTSDHRPVALSMSVPLRAIPKPSSEGAGVKDVRIQSPFTMDPLWREKRDWARKKEIIVGFMAYAGYTWEGNGVLLATLIGGVGGWLILSSMIST